MRLPETTSVECFNHPLVQDKDGVRDEVVSQSGLPFRSDWLESVVPVVIDFEEEGQLESFGLVQTTEVHARSFEFGTPNSSGHNQLIGVWADEYGNHYTSLNTKGNNNSQQRIIGSLTAPSGYIPYGLQEDDALLKVIRSSRLMREAGIDTEWITRVLEPKFIKFDDEFVNQENYKRLLAEKITAEFMASVSPSDENYDEALGELRKSTKALKNMVFFITTRAMRTPDRIGDFFCDETQEKVMDRLGRVFHAYNLTTKAGEELDVNKQGDVEYYFTELLPKLAATNLAKLHNIGLKHTFPVTGNVSALGGLVDLDSVAGAPLGFETEEPITLDDCLGDIVILLNDFERETDMQGLFHNLQALKIDVGKKPFERFCNNYMDSYLLERKFDDDIDKNRLSAAYFLLDANYCLDTIDDRSAIEAVKDYFRDAIENYKSKIVYKNDEERLYSAVQYLADDANRLFQEELHDNLVLPLSDSHVNTALDRTIDRIATTEKIAEAFRGYSYEWVDYPSYSYAGDVQKTLAKYFSDDEIETLEATFIVPIAQAIEDEFFIADAELVDMQEFERLIREHVQKEYIDKIDTTIIPDRITGEIKAKLEASLSGEMINNAHVVATCSNITKGELDSLPATFYTYTNPSITETLELTDMLKEYGDRKLRLLISDAQFDGFSLTTGQEFIQYDETHMWFSPKDVGSYVALVYEISDTSELCVVVYEHE